MKTLTTLELVLLVPVALIHCLLLRLDRWLWGAPPLSHHCPPPAPSLVAACAAPSPAAGRLAPDLSAMSVAELRRVAQARGLRQIDGIRASKARRQALLLALA